VHLRNLHAFTSASLLSLMNASIVIGYISTSINDGPGCLTLRCPDPSCGAAVGQDMINLLAPKEDKKKYSQYLLRSYIEDNRKVYVQPYSFSLCEVFLFLF